MTDSEVHINIVEVRKPEIDATLVAAVDRAAARAPRRFPPRDEARGAVGHAARRRGHPHQLRRPPRRRGDRAHRVVSRGPGAAAHAARRHRLRRRRRPTPPTAPAASRCGSSRARSWSTTRWRRSGARSKAPNRPAAARRREAGGRPEAEARRRIMLQPKRTKFRKQFKGRIHGAANVGDRADFRLLRPEGAGAGAGHRAPDRGGAARDHAPDEARRPRVDPHLPGRAGVEEADRSAHGQGQGHAGVLGVPGQAGPHHVRDRRRAGARSPARRCASARRSCRSGRASCSASPTDRARERSR